MAEQQNDALIERVPSEENLILGSRQTSRSSNGKALKVAGFTVLACLLLAGQALTAYFVWGQKQHIDSLTQGQELLKNELTRKSSAGAPKVMRLPMNSMPLLKDFSDETSDQKQTVPLTKLQPSFLSQKEGSGIMDEASRLMPKRMRLPMKTMPLLMDPDTEVNSTPVAAIEVETKCKLESVKEVKPGFFRPQCDEEGNYLPMQCWHSTGYCWCVDKNGNEIKGTRIRGKPICSTDDLIVHPDILE
ncbi:CD74 molecule, major histocompatibility complex, class II invariant chain a isoform X1 [Misgurnus anguillicaudatus]|uniref:CD74 molecule, major histocompatibility complex, class II invariant chain a isoform X1 n=1 Tax=Misgurnus anguillicaudatus TaxID=75329 RepID=UPI002434C5C9|nr:CD74 molecule, major histocompatibility complex, class II invariant chain a isoform X1 [Misgurnus anguillicaudatus]